MTAAVEYRQQGVDTGGGVLVSIQPLFMTCFAPVVKLAYTLGSGPNGRKVVGVRLPPGAPSFAPRPSRREGFELRMASRRPGNSADRDFTHER